MEAPQHLKYSKEHTWLLIEGENGTVGITEFAQSELGEIVFVDFPSVGAFFGQDRVFGSIEALKTTSDLFMPLSGDILETNGKLKDDPTLVNTDPFGEGWIVKIKMSKPDEADNLLTAAAYQAITA
ncbi:MAG TPA: glycine cleavage system protein GcvH [Saprospiraceae bacterium]|mgnify:FL=1|nr:glycine cleavage system protein GcvH [Saprospiraceae bacterium]HPI04826.1 glycine cleavage system protein GcvH [Saprospiraceae bacterium]